MRIYVERSERDHYETGEEMVALYVEYNQHQTQRIDLTVPQAHEMLEALHGHLYQKRGAA